MLFSNSDVPFELVVERICHRYKKLPSEVIEEDFEWIRILDVIIATREKATAKRKTIGKLNTELKNRISPIKVK